MTSLEYYIEQIEQFISALTDDIESGEGTVVTQTKLAVYQEVLEHLEEIEQESRYISIKTELNGGMISRQAVCKIIDDIRDCISVEGYWAFLERLEKLPAVDPTKTGHWIPVSERLPEDTDPVNITWVNHDPESYYADIKDKPFTATGHYCNGRWWWYSVTCQDYLDEYGHWDIDAMDDAIEVIAWMPLPKPYEPQEI